MSKVEIGTQMQGVWGWKAKIGLITPSVVAREAEILYKFGLEGIGIMMTACGVTNVTDERIDEAVNEVEKHAKRLVEGGADFVGLMGGPLMLVGGPEGNEKLQKRLESVTNLPCLTALTAQVNALHALSVKKVILIVPSFDIWLDRSVAFLESNGFEVVNKLGVDRTNPMTNKERRALPMSVAYNVARRAYLETPEADAIAVTCGDFGGPPAFQRLEEDCGIPVLRGLSNMIWSGLKALKIKVSVEGFGRLFETL